MSSDKTFDTSNATAGEKPGAPAAGADAVTREDLTFASADGSSTIHATVWAPADPALAAAPRAVVQIVHGMAEHVLRYDAFARYLACRGFVVAGDDHIGHGRSAAAERRGVLPAEGGADALVADEHTLRGLIASRVAPGTPYVLFGHSMGSYLARVYLGRHGRGLAGAVICGTGFVPVATSRAGHALARLLCALRGEDYRSKLVDRMGVGAYAAQVEGATGVEWISHSKENVDAYLADPLCGFMFSVGGYATLTALTAEACSRACAARMPHDLPLLYIAGAGDPVGDMGRGVRKAALLAQNAGQTNVTLRLYEGMRHEILNEDDRGRVMADVLAWMEKNVLL